MSNRRKFIKTAVLGTAALSLNSCAESSEESEAGSPVITSKRTDDPIVISTWNHGMPANEAAWEILDKGGYALDAVEAGVKIPEADPNVTSVGYGGFPDRDGKVTLDACIMDDKGDCGSVSYLQHIKHPISVARLVMEETPHVMLSGAGALRFAQEKGFIKENLLRPNSQEAWRRWKEESGYVPEPVGANNHDTIGMLALDKKGRMCGACTTSGMAWKMHGRVGDSPIIGAGLYVDGEVGGATATGVGEMVIKVCGTFLVVELMRQGASPQEACEEAVRRIAERQDIADKQVGFLALDVSGKTGSYAIHSGFEYALYQKQENKLFPSQSLNS
ncbi:MAG: N4-(beta-N-acetylglucosaminyl)-L-asparaginase [Limisphaerales bacterium]|jgi:N4-(beta-N-acetylglucosaminyl)-L-asparaginase